ncbi:MAG: ribonuclease III [Flavobacteriia bacterium]|nr:ribonuclease III [Flavobacteriia bacterium]
MLSRFYFLTSKKSKEDLNLIRFILKRFGYRPRKVHYFFEAVTHKSLSNNNAETSNERLEFLGDAILDAVIAEFLYARFPNEDEGYLTKIKAKLVSRKTLSIIAEEMELREVIRYQKGRSINLNTLEGNAFEAIMGAIYLDGGFEAVKSSINHHVFRKYVDLNRLLEEEIDFKSKLFIWSQKKQLKLEFEVISEENLGGTWEYLVQAKVNGASYGQGKGTSKKMAEQAASKETLELMGEI